MSLINDALKKASEHPAPTTPAQTKEPLRVATHQPAPRWPMFVVPPLVAIVFAAGTFLVMRGWQTGRPVSAREPATLNAAGIDALIENNKARAAADAKVETAALNASPAPAVIAPTAVPTNTAVAPASGTTFPNLKLQGVIWNPKRPSAVINGKSLFKGERVERAEVTEITSDSVTVVWKGEERVLTLQ